MIYLIRGKVIKGYNYGKKIGYPTLNIDRRNFLKMKEKPPFGIYKGKVTFVKVQPSQKKRKTYRAGIIIGPLDKNNLPKIEAHLIGYKGNAYGKQVVFKIQKFLRKFKKFKTEEELIFQIGEDLKKC